MLYQRKNLHGGDVYGDPVLLDYSSNINPLGTPMQVKEAVISAVTGISKYPDPYCRKLVAAISQAQQVPPDYILCGNGAAEVIDLYCAALRPKTAAELAPTFLEYSEALSRFNCRMMRYPVTRESSFSLDRRFLAWLQENRPEVLFLCNPNNPTGVLLDEALLGKILTCCRELGIRLFLDECFLDLADRQGSLVPLLQDNPHLFILKAFTKSYGMAGLRLGYGLTSDAALLSRMSRLVQPWNISVPAQAAGVAALEHPEFVRKGSAIIQPERKRLHEALEVMGFYVCPSSANYLLFYGCTDLESRLRAHRIAIRDCSNYYGLSKGWHRIAVKMPEENTVLLRTIQAVLQEGEKYGSDH